MSIKNRVKRPCSRISCCCMLGLLLSSCSSDKTPQVSPEVASRFVGTWVRDDGGIACETSLDLVEDRTYTWSSKEERVTGNYTLSPVPERDDLVYLQMNFLVDNLEEDCDDNAADDAGDGFDVYVNFPDDNTMYWLDEDSVLAGEAIDPGDAALLAWEKSTD
ncbi:hypothetical protein ACUNV4_08330 [Granulosicoccus sp. 3-233]|uniref:hypothetical protein n=1 Tax=Granulosicoccus sp. 3-233 TaxID=3417969 RepID=UPI003D32C98D